jgi:site-specific DNA-cytosine methylase
MPDPTIVHLFAGSGGCTLGFQRAGFRSLGSFDFDARACRDLVRLTGGPAFCRDLAAMQPAELRELTAGECPDVVVMSPPCKSFSGCMPAGRATEVRYVDMSQLAVRGVFLALEAWAPKLPRLVLLENVPRIQSRGAELLAQVVALLQRYGYTTDQRTHDCGVLGGLAQHRERFLLAALQAYITRVRLMYTTIVAYTTPVTAGRRLGLYRGAGAAASGGTAIADFTQKDASAPASQCAAG